MNGLIQSLDTVAHSIQANLSFMLSGVAILWLIHLINYFLKYRLNRLGIYPRHPLGIPGILISPFLHGNAAHLAVNSIMLFILSTMVLIGGRPLFYQVTLSIILISGTLTWLMARPGLHIGASGLIMGYWGYLILNSYQHPSILSIIVALVCLYYFSGMFMNLFPRDKRVSWEGHVFGFIAGLITSFF